MCTEFVGYKQFTLLKSPFKQTFFYGLPRDTVESLVTRRQNLTRKEFKRILESEAHPCKRFLDKPVDHGHNLRSCKTNPAHLRIPVSRTVRHKQSFIPRGAKLN